jgi:hypothetical protein
MAVKDWHPGQLAVVWAAVGVVEFFSHFLLMHSGVPDVLGYATVTVLWLVLPLGLLAITWTWFSGRPRN